MPVERVFKDQLGREILLPSPPSRIISIVPSQTELLFDLCLEERVIGITKFCVHPDEWFRTKARVGGTKKLDIEKIISLQPDLILANKEENEKEQIERLEAHVPVWISDVKNLDDACEMIASVAALTSTEEKGEQLLADVRDRFKNLSVQGATITCAYLIWKDPLMVTGGNTFISDMLHRARFENVFQDEDRYPVVTMEDLKNKKPEVIFLSSEPYPFSSRHQEEFRKNFPQALIILADGEMFSWYGSRLLKSPSYFGELRASIQAAL